MKQIVKHILHILSNKEKKNLYALAALSVIINITDLLSLAFLLFVISFYTQHITYNIPQVFTGLFDQNSILLISLFCLFFIIKNIVGYLSYQMQYRFVFNVASRISQHNILKYLWGPYKEYALVDSSTNIRKISQQPVEFGQYVLAGILQIFTEAVMVCLTIFAIFLYNARLCLMLSLLLVPPVIILSWLIKKKLKNARANIKTDFQKTLQYLNEALGAYIESKLYSKETFFSTRYSSSQKKLNTHFSELQTAQGITPRLVETFAVLGLFTIILANKLLNNIAVVNIINIGAFMAAAYKIIPSIVKISNLTGQVRTYEYTVNDLMKNVAADNIQSNTNADPINSIRFNNVSFSQNDRAILRNINMEICKGEMIGITGESGKGKTTFTNLLLGFLEPENGQICINNVPKDHYQRQQYWKYIAYTKQQPYLIYDSILNNIVLGEKEYNKQDLSNAVNKSGLTYFINKFPEGLEKTITENGKNISGGQRKRICLARALYKNADVLILDEPFNELDNNAADQILEYLKQLAEQGKMIILITHNQLHLSLCNKIYVIE